MTVRMSKGRFGTAMVGLAFALAMSGAYSADLVMSGDVEQIPMWQGRAGGLTDSDRVGHLSLTKSDATKVGVSYDKDVAQRTNMPRDAATASSVGISYDAAVAERTNMPRAEKQSQGIQAAQQPK